MARKPTISIPDRDRDAVLKVFQLSASKRERLLDSVATLEPAFEMDSVVEHLAETEGVDPETSRITAQVLLNVHATSEYTGESVDFIVDRLGEAVKEFPKGSKITRAQIGKTKQFIISALANNAFAISIKASRVMTRHANIFLKSEIISDVRAVFGSNNEVDFPEAAVVVHNLNIIHNADDENKSFYVAMDYNDLIILKRTLERAIEKHRKLSSMIEHSGLNYLEPTST